MNNHKQAGYLKSVGREIRHQAIAHGVLLYSIGNVLYLMPPYCITDTKLNTVNDRLAPPLGKGRLGGVNIRRVNSLNWYDSELVLVDRQIDKVLEKVMDNPPTK